VIATSEVYKTYSASSIEEYLVLLRGVCGATPWYRDRLWFRGVKKQSYTLLPGIYRDAEYTLGRERSKYTQFMLKAPSRYTNCPERSDYANWLLLMQHYGLPTRMLDWTASPLIALFFAIYECGTDATPSVWILDPRSLNAKSATKRPIISPLDQINHLQDTRRVFVSEADTSHSEPHFMAISPPEIDRRVIAQQSRFTIHSNQTPLDSMQDFSGILVKIEFANCKYKVMETEIQLLGLYHDDIYPDLATLAKSLQ
jgi:FRG domain